MEVLVPFADGGQIGEPGAALIGGGPTGASDSVLADLEGDGQSEAVYALPQADGTVIVEVYGTDANGQPVLKDRRGNLSARM